MNREQLQTERDAALATLNELETEAQRLQQAINENASARLQHVGAIAAFDKMLAMCEPEPAEVGNGAGAG